MTVGIYGEEEAFYRLVMSESGTWRHREFSQWREKAKRRFDSKSFLMAVDHLLDALCYDSAVDVADQLTLFLKRAEVIEEVSKNATMLTRYIGNFGGRYSLTHLKLVAKLQHEVRGLIRKTETGRSELSESQKVHSTDILKDMFLSPTGRSPAATPQDSEMGDQLSRFFDRLMSGEGAAINNLVEISESRHVPPTPDEIALLRQNAGEWENAISSLVETPRTPTPSEADEDEDSIVIFAQEIGIARELLYVQVSSGYVAEIAVPWRHILGDPRLAKQLGYIDRQDLHDTTKLALQAYLNSSNTSALGDAVFLLRHLVDHACSDDSENTEYVETLFAALRLLYESTGDPAAFMELVARIKRGSEM